MDALTKLRINLSCLIRLTQTELYDSIDDLKRNLEMIDSYEHRDLVKYKNYINQLKSINNIYTDSIIHVNNKLKSYYKELSDINYFINSLDEINKLQSNLEQSISNLEYNKLKIKEYNNSVKNKSITIVSSETDHLTNEVLRNYEDLQQAKLKKYRNEHENTLIKKYD